MPGAVSEVSPSREGAGRIDLVRQVNGEAQSIRAAQSGDAHAFNDLVLAYQERVYRLAYRILGDQEAASDATQEAFISAYRHIGAFRGGSLQPWLMRIVTNACYDQLRKKQRQHADLLDASAGDPDEATLRPAHPSPESPQDLVERREQNDLIQQGIEGLPFEQRITLIMADIEGYTYAQIAEMTQANVGTVKSRLARGRDCLRNFLLAEQDLLPAKYRRSRD